METTGKSTFAFNYRHLGTACFLCALTPLVAAQGVTLYGTVDGGIALLNGGAGTSTIKAVTSGVSSASRWGVRGSEDLGGGMKAIFQLEAGLDLDTGAAKSYSGNPGTATPTAPNGLAGTGFNRRSYVGLEGAYGRLALGRDYTPGYFAAMGSDIFRLSMFGNLQQIVQPAGGSERFARVSNALFYTSPRLGGFVGRAAYSLGSESAGGANALPKGANTFIGIGSEYAVGGLTLNASYQELKFPVVASSAFTGQNAKRKDVLVGGKYSFGDFAVTAGYWRIGFPQNASDAWLGASMKVGAGTVLAQVQRLRQDNLTGAERQGIVFGLAYSYLLSKRTSLYASYGRVSNNSTGVFAITSSDVSAAAAASGADPSALAFGIRHSF